MSHLPLNDRAVLADMKRAHPLHRLARAENRVAVERTLGCRVVAMYADDDVVAASRKATALGAFRSSCAAMNVRGQVLDAWRRTGIAPEGEGHSLAASTVDEYLTAGEPLNWAECDDCGGSCPRGRLCRAVRLRAMLAAIRRIHADAVESDNDPMSEYAPDDLPARASAWTWERARARAARVRHALDLSEREVWEFVRWRTARELRAPAAVDRTDAPPAAWYEEAMWNDLARAGEPIHE